MSRSEPKGNCSMHDLAMPIVSLLIAAFATALTAGPKWLFLRAVAQIVLLSAIRLISMPGVSIPAPPALVILVGAIGIGITCFAVVSSFRKRPPIARALAD